MASAEKRKAPENGSENASAKRPKGKKWITPRQHHAGSAGNNGTSSTRKDIEPGDAGIWASCNKGKEAKCVAELKDLFQDYATKLYNPEVASQAQNAVAVTAEDVDAEMTRELESLRNSSSQSLFTSVRLDTPCLVFFKVQPPIEPASFVYTICKDASANSSRKQSRSIKRLTPITLFAKATEKGLGEVAQQVLGPHFHSPGISSKKFAIRPNVRNHSILTRDSIIKQVATAVGPGHQVDLKSYDLLILIEVYKNVCGMSVVGGDFEELKKYNLSEIFEPTPAPPKETA